jgi:SM-20-related protein
MPKPEFFKQLGLLVIPNFVEQAWGAELCRQMAAAPVEQALVVGPTGKERLDQTTRKVDSSILPKEIKAPLKQRLRELIPAVDKHFSVQVADCESPQYLIYRIGDFFKPHLDGGTSEVTRRRVVSAVIFLNRESQEPAEGAYGGGELTFYGLLKGPQWEKCGLSLQAEPGLLVAFPSDMLHEVKPVLHGQRFTAVTWFTRPEPPPVVNSGGAGGAD